ncbi:MAG TPA: phasin family protein [Thermoanaerobaculia bacterium]|jgi:hypothetical protein|nr:phasin family protein [Thermoanaerobaculia bacterium]
MATVLPFRDIWLAGLGALSRTEKEGDRSFEELVRLGHTVEIGSKYAALVGTIMAAIEQREVSKDALIEAMLPKSALPTAPAVLQARRNAAARLEMISEFGLLSSSEVAELAGSRSANRAALANRWKQEGRLFTVTHRGETRYPGFQFDREGQPLAAVAQVLKSLGRQSSEWELALWFTASNGWLGARRPVDLLEREPEAVIEAARREAEELVF